jgi:hypothetical protein
MSWQYIGRRRDQRLKSKGTAPTPAAPQADNVPPGEEEYSDRKCGAEGTDRSFRSPRRGRTRWPGWQETKAVHSDNNGASDNESQWTDAIQRPEHGLEKDHGGAKKHENERCAQRPAS